MTSGQVWDSEDGPDRTRNWAHTATGVRALAQQLVMAVKCGDRWILRIFLMFLGSVTCPAKGFLPCATRNGERAERS